MRPGRRPGVRLFSAQKLVTDKVADQVGVVELTNTYFFTNLVLILFV